MAPVLDPGSGSCGDDLRLYSGRIADRRMLEFMHIPLPPHLVEKREPGRAQRRGRSDAEHGVMGCPRHHRGGWATSKAGLARLRDYLRYPGPPD